MIKMRIMTCAFLVNGNKLLMLKRSKERTIAPNQWTGIGGHVEADEHDNPEESCKREIYEETGIKSNELDELELRYILMRRRNNEIRQHYIYFGKTSKTDLINSDEGKLHWIELSQVLNLEIPLTLKHMLKHFFDSPDEHSVYIGSINQSKMEWSCLSK